MELDEFIKQTRKCRGHRKCKINNSWGVYDCYKLIRKNHWYNISRPLKEKEFYSIIRKVNLMLVEELLKGTPIVFPHGMGGLLLKKYEPTVGLIDGKLKIGYPVNWLDTLKLWYEDEEAKKNKTLLRREEKYIFRVVYTRYKAHHPHVKFYKFSVGRTIKAALCKRIRNGQIDTLW